MKPENLFKSSDSKSSKTAVLCIGLQASGKSTFCDRYLSQWSRVSLDIEKTRAREWKKLECGIAQCERIVIDNTNPEAEIRRRYIERLREDGYQVTGLYFQSKVKDCQKRNAQRDGVKRVPDLAIAGTSRRLVLPSLSEGFDVIYYVKIEEPDFVIDLWRESNEIQ